MGVDWRKVSALATVSLAVFAALTYWQAIHSTDRPSQINNYYPNQNTQSKSPAVTAPPMVQPNPRRTPPNSEPPPIIYEPPVRPAPSPTSKLLSSVISLETVSDSDRTDRKSTRLNSSY